MKGSTKRRPSDYVQAQLGTERVGRMWQAVASARARPAPATRAFRAWTWAAAACASLALCWWALTPRPGEEPVTRMRTPNVGEVVVASQDATALTLPDGSGITLDQATELEVLSASTHDVHLHLFGGVARYEVAPNPARLFRVDAAGFSVLTRGTQFQLGLTEPIGRDKVLSVRVARGEVEVRDGSFELVSTLVAGQSWSQAIEERVVVERTIAPEREVDSMKGKSEQASVSEPKRARPVAKREKEAPADEPSAASLLEDASGMRMAGRHREAAAGYELLQRRFPRDVRAGLAAFELARIRLDSLADPVGALAALDFALAKRAVGFVREDAEALRVDALGRLGAKVRCEQARQAFLDAHPRSAHGARVRQACGE